MSTLNGFASSRERGLLPLVRLTLLASCMLWLPAHAKVTLQVPGHASVNPCPSPAIAPIVVTYLVKPSVTDNGAQCIDADPKAIGCNGYSFSGSVRRDAPNDLHVLMLNGGKRKSGNLLVFFPDFNQRPSDANDRCAGINCRFYETAARQGYHVIALSYFNESTPKNSSKTDPVHNMDVKCEGDKNCYGKFMNEVFDGNPDCDASTCGSQLKIAKHTQDSIVGRLKAVLAYAHAQHPCDGWDRYIKDDGNLDYEKIALSGFRHGASYAAFIGLKEASSIRRVVMLSGPMDGIEEASDGLPKPAAYIHDAGSNAHKFFGIAHISSPEETLIDGSFYVLGMMPLPMFNDKFRYAPHRNQHFDYAPTQVLFPIDGTPKEDADFVVIRDLYGDCLAPPGSEDLCEIGYEDGWKYMLGTTGK